MLSGRAMRRHLDSLGVSAQKVVLKRETHHYVAEFFVPEMSTAIDPAHDWAKRIQQALPSAHIIDTHDTVADWRSGDPVIHATVVFEQTH
ncbi:MAG: hypothetical protein AAFV98_22620 [Chloroflexota bacterium]